MLVCVAAQSEKVQMEISSGASSLNNCVCFKGESEGKLAAFTMSIAKRSTIALSYSHSC